MVRLARHETGLSPPVKYFGCPFQGGASFVDHLCYLFLVFVMLSRESVYWCLVNTCWERTDPLALVCDVYLWSCRFPIGILGQVWCLIVSIPDLYPLSYFVLFTFCIWIFELFNAPPSKAKWKDLLNKSVNSVIIPVFFFFRKKGILISYQSQSVVHLSVCLFVCLSVRASFCHVSCKCIFS